MNSKKPPHNLPNDKMFQRPKDAPQSLPQEDDLTAQEPLDVETEDEKLKRIEREGEINKVNPVPETNTGTDTTGVGQPSIQPVNQGQSLPQSAIPVEKKFEGTAHQFYDPNASEAAIVKKDKALRGGQKADY